jgi:hypothetical protein
MMILGLSTADFLVSLVLPKLLLVSHALFSLRLRLRHALLLLMVMLLMVMLLMVMLLIQPILLLTKMLLLRHLFLCWFCGDLPYH